MKKYNVFLARHYVVTILAKNEEDAVFYSEYFVGDVKDASRKAERDRFKFKILDIEPTHNEAFDVEEAEDE